MRKMVTALFASAVIVILSCAKAFAQQPTLPDYTRWYKSVSQNSSVVLNDRNVNLLSEFYINLDVDNLYHHGVFVIYDEQRRPWIALYTRVILYRDGDRLVPAGTSYWSFEASNGGWSFVRDFSQSQELDKETAEFLKNRYNLEL